MNPRFLAVICWLLAWLAVSLAAACGWAAARGRSRVLAVTAAAGWLLAAAVLANAGTDLW